MARLFRFSPRFPFHLSAILLSLALSIGTAVFSSTKLKWSYIPNEASTGATIAAFHHIIAIMMFCHDSTDSRSQNTRACKFYVRALWVPIIISAVALFNLVKYLAKFSAVVQIVLTSLEMVLLLYLTFTAQYKEAGSIALPADAESTTQPEGRSPRTLRVPRLLRSKHSFHPSSPFSVATLGLSLILACGILGLSFANEGRASFGLNIAGSTLYIGLGSFIALAYTESSPLNSDSSGSKRPVIYSESPETLDFLRVSLRLVYLIGASALAFLSFIGATIAGYHWMHCRYISYMGGYSRWEIFLETAFGYTLTIVSILGLIAPLMEDLEISVLKPGKPQTSEREVSPLRGAAPGAEPIIRSSTVPAFSPTTEVPRSRLPFKLPLFVLSCLMGAAWKVSHVLNYHDMNSELGFQFVYFHHIIVIGIFTLISDFDRTSYIPTLHGKTACKAYVWTLIVPILFLIIAAIQDIIYITSLRHNNDRMHIMTSLASEVFVQVIQPDTGEWRPAIIELVCSIVEVIVLVSMVATATYYPYPSSNIPQVLPESEHPHDHP